MAAPDFGTDVSTFPILDPVFLPITGVRVLAEVLARIYQTPQGSDTWHPDWGRDLRRYLNEPMTPEVLAQLQAEAEEGAELDERIQQATATAVFNEPAATVLLSVRVLTATGPFLFTFSLDAATVVVLSAR
jgi:phage baseplate assembly protein W